MEKILIIYGKQGVGKTRLQKELEKMPIFDDVAIFTTQDKCVEENLCSPCYVIGLKADNYEEVKNKIINHFKQK